MAHIRATLPDIKARISQQLQKYNAELQTLGGGLGDQSSSGIVLSVITEFCSEFRTTIDGNTNDLSLNELSGGARISFVFHELFNNGIKTIDPFDQVKDAPRMPITSLSVTWGGTTVAEASSLSVNSSRSSVVFRNSETRSRETLAWMMAGAKPKIMWSWSRRMSKTGAGSH